MILMINSCNTIPDNLIKNVLEIDFWREFAPNLTINEKACDHKLDFTQNQKEALVKSLIKKGYVHLQQPQLTAPYSDMTMLVQKLIDIKLPPVFSFIYDEFWNIRNQLQEILRTFFDGQDYAQLPDFWAWHVAPGQSGWEPHRDKSAINTLFRDNKPKSLTVWLPLSVANPINGCMYIIPADHDHGYGLSAPASKMLSSQVNLSDIRALPCEAGDALFWTSMAYHWGSRSADDHDFPPRMSISFEFQRLDVSYYNQPLLGMDTLLTFQQRLALIAKQIKQYSRMAKMGVHTISMAREIANKCRLPDSVVTDIPRKISTALCQNGPLLLKRLNHLYSMVRRIMRRKL